MTETCESETQPLNQPDLVRNKIDEEADFKNQIAEELTKKIKEKIADNNKLINEQNNGEKEWSEKGKLKPDIIEDIKQLYKGCPQLGEPEVDRYYQRLKKAELIKLYKELDQQIQDNNYNVDIAYNPADMKPIKIKKIHTKQEQARFLTNCNLTINFLTENIERKTRPADQQLLKGLYDNTKEVKEELTAAYEPFCHEYQELVEDLMYYAPILSLAGLQAQIIGGTISQNIQKKGEQVEKKQ